MSAPQEFRPVVVAPTFDNARTLEAVVTRIASLGLPLIVINDGCRDGSGEVLKSLQATTDRLTVVTHPVNRGKAAALRTGFEQLIGAGFTHAVTIDTDGQLDPAQIPDLLRAAEESPTAIVIGSRDENAKDYPTPSRVGRFWSNVLVFWESGARVSDSQCGFRVYPLRNTLALDCRASRYGFETEVLVRAAWANLPIVEVPVTCRYDVPEGRVTHFRKWRDSFAAAGMHVRLLSRSLMPWPVRRLVTHADGATGTLCTRFFHWINPVRAWRAIRHDPRERSRFAAGLATGVFIANLPLYGVQTLLSLVIARRFRLNPLPVVVGSHLSTPPIGPLLIALALAIGHWVLHGTLPAWGTYNPVANGYLSTLRSAFIEWTVGGIVCGAILAAGTFLVTRLVLWHMPQSPGMRPAAPRPILDRATAKSAA